MWQERHDRLRLEIVSELVRLSRHPESISVEEIVSMMGSESINDLL